MILKLGSKGQKVKELQVKLNIPSTGIFDNTTHTAVKGFQKSKNLLDDGIVGNKTAQLLGIILESLDTDNTHYNHVSGDLIIKKSYLDKDEYYDATHPKEWLILHHTAGAHNPFNVVKDWNSDTRGRIGTQFIIGGKGLDGESSNDGVVVECMPDKSWAYHIGNNGNSLLHPRSIGIEICNWGYVTKRADGEFIAYTGKVVPKDQVVDLGFKFRGYQYYHRYTDKQLEVLVKLIKEIAKRNPGINLKSGIQQWVNTQSANDAFEYKDDAFTGKIKGVLTHTHIRKDKTDCYPDPRLIQLLKGL